MESIVSLWKTIRSNPYFVAFEGGAGGASLNIINDALRTGGLDTSPAGLRKLALAAAIGGIAAVRALYRPAPGSNPNQ